MSRTTVEQPLRAPHTHSNQARNLIDSEPMKKRAHASSSAHPLLTRSIAERLTRVMKQVGSSQTSAYIESYELGLY